MKRRLWLLPVCLAVGCSAKVPPLSPASQAMVRKFEQQIDRHKTQTFEEMCKEIEKLHSDKKITDEEHAALHSVCGQASRGEWDRAKGNLDLLVKSMAEKKE